MIEDFPAPRHTVGCMITILSVLVSLLSCGIHSRAALELELIALPLWATQDECRNSRPDPPDEACQPVVGAPRPARTILRVGHLPNITHALPGFQFFVWLVRTGSCVRTRIRACGSCNVASLSVSETSRSRLDLLPAIRASCRQIINSPRRIYTSALLGHDNIPPESGRAGICLLLSFFCIAIIDVHQASRSELTGIFCSTAPANPNRLITEGATLRRVKLQACRAPGSRS